jgi:hypothetical protein
MLCMKKLFFTTLILSAVLISCNNDSETETTDGQTPLTGVENVNGNIPETTNAIRLGDTTVIDTMRR